MAPREMKVIPIRRDVLPKERQRAIVELAFEYWLTRFGVRYGSPEDDFCRAQREVMARSSKCRKGGAVHCTKVQTIRPVITPILAEQDAAPRSSEVRAIANIAKADADVPELDRS